MTTIADVWDYPNRPWPSVVYVETTNRCNADCAACLNGRVLRKRMTMSQEVFERVADKVKARGLKIGALFCFGEPLLDRGLFAKYRYARKIDVLSPEHVGLNTNVSMLTQDLHEEILESTPNITLSFFNVGSEYERLTRLRWSRSYANAIRFIESRDRLKPRYKVFIGVNKVAGHDLEAVKAAFAGYRVEFVQDAELRYAGGAIIDGVTDRTRMYPSWRCDGYKGAIQVKPDGGAEFCAYDIIGTRIGGETRFGHFLEDSWADLERQFRAAWRQGSSLCQRCDYWHQGRAVIAEVGGDVECEIHPKPPPLVPNW